MAGSYWNPKFWTEGNFYPEYSVCSDSLAVAVAAPLGDSGKARDTDGSHPVMAERNVGVDRMAATGFVTSQIGGADMWDDSGVNHLEVHFTTVAARQAYAMAVLNAPTDEAKAAVAKQYRDSAVGGNWGTVGVAL